MTRERITFVAAASPAAQSALLRLRARYGDAGEAADVIVALGGDGLMLQTLHEAMDSAGRPHSLPIYGMNQGTVGFLMNPYEEEDLPARLAAAEPSFVQPLIMTVRDRDGRSHQARAVNEVSVFRQTHQTARIRITVDDRVRLDALTCDGVLLSTPAGSTAYNLSVHGPILPFDAGVLALTPISAFRPRRWRGALLSHKARVTWDVLEPDKRPVAAVADNDEVRDVVSVTIEEDAGTRLQMLFDPGYALADRILDEQFVP